MQHDPDRARRDLAAARALREEAGPRWRAAIIAARAAGIPAAEVALIAGCTRQRVEQIHAQHGKNANCLDARPGGP